jgi:uroporphyrin-III C-methyltransferase
VTGAARVAPAPAPLPAASAPSAGRTAASAPLPASPGVATPVEKLLAYLTPATWFQSILNNVKGEAGKLLRVSSIKEPEAALLAPEQSFFLRENFKLRLLNARLSLLSRQTEAARSDLVAANGWLVKYFDANSRKTQSAAQSLQQIQAQIKTSELPRLDETMAALATAAAGR